MIKVLHICYGVATGGVAAVIYNYYTHMDHEAVHFDVAAQSYKNDQSPQMYGELLKKQGCEIFYLPPKSQEPINNLRQMAKIIRQGRYDILHIHMGPASLPYVLLAKLMRVPNVIVHVHGAFDHTGWSSSPATRVQRSLQNCLHGYERMACSEEAARQLWGDHAQVRILRNAFDIEAFRAQPSVRNRLRKELGLEEKFVLIDVGRLSAGKQPQQMIDIFCIFKELRPESVLVMVGTGELENEVKRYAASRGLDETQVKFLGARQDVPQLLQAADVFVLPTLGEGLGIAYIEAQAAGLPCFAPEGCVPREVALTPLFHTVAEKQSSHAWADAILAHADERRTDPPLEIIREAGYEICAEARKLEQYYEKLLEGDTANARKAAGFGHRAGL